MLGESDGMKNNTLQRIASLQLQGKNEHQGEFLKIVAGDIETIKKWSTPLTNAERQDRNNAIFYHWLAGETTTEIAKRAYLNQGAVVRIINVMRVSRLEAMHISETPPIYNVWNYAFCDPRFGQKHPGQFPGQAIINLLLWLIKPFDVVVDTMAGGGTTIDEMLVH